MNIDINGFDLLSENEYAALKASGCLHLVSKPFIVKSSVFGKVSYVDRLGVIRRISPQDAKTMNLYLRPVVYVSDFPPDTNNRIKLYGSLWTGTGRGFLINTPIKCENVLYGYETEQKINEFFFNHFTNCFQKESISKVSEKIDYFFESRNNAVKICARNRIMRNEIELAEVKLSNDGKEIYIVGKDNTTIKIDAEELMLDC